MSNPSASLGAVTRVWPGAAVGGATSAATTSAAAQGPERRDIAPSLRQRPGRTAAVRATHGRIADPELLEVGRVARGIVVVLAHERPVLVHDPGVELDRWPVLGADQGPVLHGLRLNVAEIVPRLPHQLGPEQEVEHGPRHYLGARR